MKKRAAHCKTLERQVMNKKMDSNSREHVQKQHLSLSFNSRMASSLSEVFLTTLRAEATFSRYELACEK